MIEKILSVGFLIGCMDGAAACINAYILVGVNPVRVFQYIASGLLGSEAFSGGIAVVLLGVLIHFFIAITATGVFFQCYTRIFSLDKYYLFHGVLYGILVWGVMNLVVVPLSAVSTSDPKTIQIIIQLLIHIFIIGIPISYFAYSSSNPKIAFLKKE